MGHQEDVFHILKPPARNVLNTNCFWSGLLFKRWVDKQPRYAFSTFTSKKIQSIFVSKQKMMMIKEKGNKQHTTLLTVYETNCPHPKKTWCSEMAPQLLIPSSPVPLQSVVTDPGIWLKHQQFASLFFFSLFFNLSWFCGRRKITGHFATTSFVTLQKISKVFDILLMLMFFQHTQ